MVDTVNFMLRIFNHNKKIEKKKKTGLTQLCGWKRGEYFNTFSDNYGYPVHWTKTQQVVSWVSCKCRVWNLVSKVLVSWAILNCSQGQNKAVFSKMVPLAHMYGFWALETRLRETEEFYFKFYFNLFKFDFKKFKLDSVIGKIFSMFGPTWIWSPILLTVTVVKPKYRSRYSRWKCSAPIEMCSNYKMHTEF